MRNLVKEAWSQIDVQLKRRHDLIPNLVETVKGYAGHEKSTLDAVVKARSQAVQATGVADKSRAEQELSGALGRLMVLVEQYPDLKANQNFLALQEELTSTENKIGFFAPALQRDGDAVQHPRSELPAQPGASAFGFKEEAFFELEDKKEREVPKVQF